MHIAFLMQDTGTIYGAERATLDLVKILRASDTIRVTVYYMNELRLALSHSEIVGELEKMGVSAVSLPVRHAFSPSLICALRAALRRDHVDMLHPVGYKADLHGGWAAGFGKGVPVVSTVHGWLFRPDLKERFDGWVDIRVLRRFQKVIVLSSYYEDFLRRSGIPAEALVRIPSGYPAPDAIVRRVVKAPFVVGILGRLSWEKNHDMFLAVARELRNEKRSVRFVIAGDGPDALRRMAEAGLKKLRTEFSVARQRDEHVALYQSIRKRRAD